MIFKQHYNLKPVFKHKTKQPTFKYELLYLIIIKKIIKKGGYYETLVKD